VHIKRTLSKAVQKASKSFRVILLTGPRQVGKTTLLQDLQKTTRSYVTLDDLNTRIKATDDPAGFIQLLDLPVLIDEVQYAPELFSYIKMIVDQEKKTGLFWLTGSQQFEMMKNVRESLAGRVGILRLQGISLAEIQGRENLAPFLPTPEIIKERQQTAKPLTLPEVFHKIWCGSYPEVVIQDGENWEIFYDSYVTTYIQRDVRDYLKISDQAQFLKFMQIAASRTGQLLKYSDIATAIGVSEPTIKSWLTVLEASGIIYILQPYFNNQTKRFIKTPKLYFMDTGLCSYLTGWLNPGVLVRGAMSGAMLETYVVAEIIKSYLHNGRNPRIYFYRDKEQYEIDLLIEENGVLHPLEIKQSASLKNIDIKAFKLLPKLKATIGRGAVICLIKDPLPVIKDVTAINVGYI
jgi:uncharacterized protein